MMFPELDHGAILRKETELDTLKMVRLVIGNPLIIKEMAKHVQSSTPRPWAARDCSLIAYTALRKPPSGHSRGMWTTDSKETSHSCQCCEPGTIDTPGLSELLASSEAGEQRKKMNSPSPSSSRKGRKIG
jgi:hypothetical protein